MSDFSFGLDLEEHQQHLDDEIEDWSENAPTWVVGTAVEYAIYVEFGTSERNPRPFFRPVLTEAKRDLSEFVRRHTETSLSRIDNPDELTRVIALALARRVKEVITEKGLIDTGTMRASVKAARGDPDPLPVADDVDPDATQSLEVRS